MRLVRVMAGWPLVALVASVGLPTTARAAGTKAIGPTPPSAAASGKAASFLLADGSSPFHGTPRLAWGGHVEVRLGHDRTRGTSNPDWFSFGRANGFARARLGERWRLTGEGTYDRGTDHFVLEHAEMAYQWKATLVAHAGIFPLPLGGTNLSHDAPRNDFAEHSLVATQIVGVPNAMLGLGVRGAAGAGRRMTYELDAVTGFDDGLLFDAAGGTRLVMGRSNYADNNGLPAVTGRMAFHGSNGREWGLAAISGPYNQTKIEGITVDAQRWVHVVVADGNMKMAGLSVAAEGAVAFIDVPPGLLGLYAEDQWAGSVEMSRTIGDPLFRKWKHSALRVALRGDAVDFDRGLAGDSRHRVSASLNLHRKPYAVARLGWYYEIQRDRFNNQTPHAGITFTAASYF